MISKAKFNFIKALHQKKSRQKEGLFLVEGAKMINELLTSDFEIVQMLLTAETVENYSSRNSNVFKNLVIDIIDEDQLSKISSLQNVSAGIAIVKIKQQKLNTLQIADLAKENLILLLDHIQDPGNLGTIIRIADWFGIKNIVCSTDTVDFYNSKTIQSTMGSIFRVEVSYADLEDLLETSPRSIPVFGALLDGKSIYGHPLSKNGFIVLGNESRGINSLLLPYISYKIKIPSFGNAESLNVGIAAGIICSEFKSRYV